MKVAVVVGEMLTGLKVIRLYRIVLVKHPNSVIGCVPLARVPAGKVAITVTPLVIKVKVAVAPPTANPRLESVLVGEIVPVPIDAV